MTAWETYIRTLKTRKVGILGFGVSNRPVAREFQKAGLSFTIYDKASVAQLGDEAAALEKAGVQFVTGPDYLERLTGDDYIVRSPGMLPIDQVIIDAYARGVEVVSEMSLFFRFCPCKIIGVTGSDGKTTTTTLTAKILEAAGYRVHLGGNMGTPLIDRLNDIQPDDYAVLELSSFQLFDLPQAPHISIATNMSPNHLDRHTDMREYIDAKRNIYLNQKPGDLLVVNTDNAITRDFANDAPGHVMPFSGNGDIQGADGVLLRDGVIYYRKDGQETPVLQASEIVIPGRHNVENYMAAIGATYPLAGIQAVRQVATTFAGVEHRLELVRTLHGVKYYNSSIDSTPSRSTAALSVFPQKVIIILGGSDKNISFDAFGEVVCEKVKLALLTGDTSEKIGAAIEKAKGTKPEMVYTADLAEAIQRAQAYAKPGDIVLLSPACASFDRFKNFEERGRVFRQLVNALS